MKRVYFLTVLLLYLKVQSQTTYYKGEWSRAATSYNYSALVKLTITDNYVAGEILWKMISADSLDKNFDWYNKKVGVTGIEKIKGTFNARTSDLQFSGFDKIDPDTVIGLDIYTLKFSSNKKIIFGKTFSGGADNGCFYAIRVDNGAGAEFQLQKTKLEKR